MNRLLELTSKLSPAEVRQVEDFAESIAAQHEAAPEAQPPVKHINVDAIIGICKDIGGDLSDKELIHEAWDHLLKKYD